MIPSSPNWLYLFSRYPRRSTRSFLARLILLWPIVSGKQSLFIALPARENWLLELVVGAPISHRFWPRLPRDPPPAYGSRRIVSDLTREAGDAHHRIHDVEEWIRPTTISR